MKLTKKQKREINFDIVCHKESIRQSKLDIEIAQSNIKEWKKMIKNLRKGIHEN